MSEAKVVRAIKLSSRATGRYLDRSDRFRVPCYGAWSQEQAALWELVSALTYRAAMRFGFDKSDRLAVKYFQQVEKILYLAIRARIALVVCHTPSRRAWTGCEIREWRQFYSYYLSSAVAKVIRYCAIHLNTSWCVHLKIKSNNTDVHIKNILKSKGHSFFTIHNLTF
jgi:hypothetical protein